MIYKFRIVSDEVDNFKREICIDSDASALKNIRKYIDMVVNKQQLSAPGGKTPEKESVLKKLNDGKAALEQKKLQPQQKATEHTL